ncbi:MAG: hypothetical protein ACKOWD_09000, partial [Rhodoferax sp.]
RENEIRRFLVQIASPEKMNDIWIVGDGKSWGRWIEYTDMTKANQDAIDRIANIFCEWMRECSNIDGEGSLKDLLKRFEINLKSDPKRIFKLIPAIQKMPDHQFIKLINDFCERG